MKYTKWSLQYSSEITEDVYKKIIAKLHGSGLTFEKWCGMELGYESFKNKKWMRTHHTLSNKYVIDNHSNLQTQISFRDILEETSSSSLSTDIFKAGDRVRAEDHTSRGDGVVIGKASNTNDSYLVDHDKWSRGHTGNGTSLQWGRYSEKNSAWYYSPSELSLVSSVVSQPITSFEYVTAIGSTEYVQKDKIYKCKPEGKFEGYGFTIEKAEHGDSLEPNESFPSLRLSTVEEIKAAKAGYSTLQEYKDAYISPKPKNTEYGDDKMGVSKWGYRIGQRIEMKNMGWCPGVGLRCDECADKGTKGTITGFKGVYTEILLDNGKYVTRMETYCGEYLELLGEHLSLKNKFSIGNLVIGNASANVPYSTTEEGWIGLVEVVTGDKILVRGRNRLGIEDTYTVDAKYFDLYTGVPAATIDKRDMWMEHKEYFKEHPLVYKTSIPPREEEKYIQSAVIIKKPKRKGIKIV